MPISGDIASRRYGVAVEARRQWSLAQKRAIVAETLQGAATVSQVARRHGVNASLVFRWRRIFAEAAQRRPRQPDKPAFVPVALPAPPANGAALEDKAPTAKPPGQPGSIEIELINGRRIRVGADADIALPRRLADVLERR